MEKNIEKKEKKNFTILGINIWEILSYFIIYSIAGFIIETLFALIRYGVLESRQSFLYGPFCSIYGLGAVIMIIFLQYFLKNNFTLFAGGFIIGSITEYLVSLIGELILHVKWWDYSNMPLNINGRICFYYSIFWGLLAIFLMKVIHPHVRRFMALILKKFSKKPVKIAILSITIFMFLDCLISGYAIDFFIIRMVAENDLNVANKETIYEINDRINNNAFTSTLVNSVFNNKKMIKTYPNLKVQLVDGSMVYMKDLHPEIQPYYFRFDDKDYYK